jgi:hypothetical protein
MAFGALALFGCGSTQKNAPTDAQHDTSSGSAGSTGDSRTDQATDAGATDLAASDDTAPDAGADGSAEDADSGSAVDLGSDAAATDSATADAATPDEDGPTTDSDSDAAPADVSPDVPDSSGDDGSSDASDASDAVDGTPVPPCDGGVPYTQQLIATDNVVMFGTIQYFNAGMPIPAGRYTVRYVDGCMKYAPQFDWSVNGNLPPTCCNWWFVGTDSQDRRVLLPGTVGSVAPDGAWTNFEDCVTANKLQPPKVFDHAGGKLGLFMDDIQYDDNVAGVSGRNPTYSLTQTCGP